ncbi:MAG: hypothetical protein PWQ06_738 [Anaerophaga sp.]|jgi:hypothetical protein|nr:hypothetical protein [Anaerophaga sp.]
MKELRFENLYSPEYYHEVPNLDSRIAIRKFLDARETMGLAGISLSYIDTTPTDDFEKNFIRTIYLRHALIDLNNSFDLLLQIPWLYFRAWNEFNRAGSLRTRELKNRNEIIRNTDDWVYQAERECSIAKLLSYLNKLGNPIKSKVEDFIDSYVQNAQKLFTVRSLCNTLKHNHVLSFKELYSTYNFTVNINGVPVNLRENNLGIEYKQEFYDQEKSEQSLGEIRTVYSSDLAIDIEYYGGDLFRFSDCTHESDMLNISDVVSECVSYYDALVVSVNSSTPIKRSTAIVF